MAGWLVILLLTVLIIGGFAAVALWMGNRLAAADDRRTELMRERYREERLRNPYAHNCGVDAVHPPTTPTPPTTAVSRHEPPPVPKGAPVRAELVEDDDAFDAPVADLPVVPPVPATPMGLPGDDPSLPAYERAQRAWPRFLHLWEAYRHDTAHRFFLRTPLHGSDVAESCWLRPTTIDGPQNIVIGVLTHTPARLRSVRKGERVRVRLGSNLAGLQDWRVETPDGEEGGFGSA